MSRRAKGTRSSTFGNVRKLPSGRWQASYWHEGNRCTADHTFPAKATGDAWLANVRTDIGKGAWIDPDAGAITLRKYADKWLEDWDVAESTRELYRHLLDAHILPTFGDTQLASLKTPAIRTWNARLARQHPTTAAKAYRLLATILKTAVGDHKLVVSPCTIKGAANESAPERPVATIAEIQALADAMPDRQRIAVLLAAWCQLRRGELLGLRRQDVDLLHEKISVRTTRVKTMGGSIVEKGPKSDAGSRTVAVPANVLPDLKRHLDEYVGPDPGALLLDGGYRPLRTAWDNARRTTGLTCHLHDLRHTGLTLAAAAGATVAELMKRAGHASPAAALRYQHATEDRDRALADALAGLASAADVVPIEAKQKSAPRQA